MLQLNAFEPVHSKWASLILFATRNTGLQLCVDYCQLNSVTLRDAYLMTLMNKCIDSLGEVLIFSTLNVHSGYWQIGSK